MEVLLTFPPHGVERLVDMSEIAECRSGVKPKLECTSSYKEVRAPMREVLSGIPSCETCVAAVLLVSAV